MSICDPGQQAAPPSVVCPADVPQSVDDALSMVMTGFGWLADADLAGIPAAVRADCLRQLERVRSVQTAAHAAVLSAFDHDASYADDGQGTSRSWLRWQTRVTAGAASGWVGWMRAHPAVNAALRAGAISESWGKQICEWTDLLPESARQDADTIVLAAAGGAELADLASLVEQMRCKLARPDDDGDPGRGFEERWVRLATTIGGAGRLDGDLTPGCATAVQAVLEALEDACRRLIAVLHHDECVRSWSRNPLLSFVLRLPRALSVPGRKLALCPPSRSMPRNQMILRSF